MTQKEQWISQREKLLEETVSKLGFQYQKYEKLIHDFLLNTMYTDGQLDLQYSDYYYISKITEYLRQLGVAVNDIADGSIEQAYILGLLIFHAEVGSPISMQEATKTIQASGIAAALKDSSATALNTTISNTLARLKTLINSQRNSSNMITLATSRDKERLLKLLEKNNTPEAFSKTLKSMGFVGIVDNADRTWRPEVYARMVLRTQLMEADVAVKKQEAQKARLDLAYIPDKHVDNPCNLWEHTVISLNGQDHRFPTYSRAKSTGEIFHPNCQHGHLTMITDWHTVPLDVISKTEQKYGIKIDLSESLLLQV